MACVSEMRSHAASTSGLGGSWKREGGSSAKKFPWVRVSRSEMGSLSRMGAAIVSLLDWCREERVHTV